MFGALNEMRGKAVLFTFWRICLADPNALQSTDQLCYKLTFKMQRQQQQRTWVSNEVGNSCSSTALKDNLAEPCRACNVHNCGHYYKAFWGKKISKISLNWYNKNYTLKSLLCFKILLLYILVLAQALENTVFYFVNLGEFEKQIPTG